MKQQVSPMLVAVTVVVLVAVIAAAGYKYLGGTAKTGIPTSSVPPGTMSAGMVGRPNPGSGGMGRMSGGMSAGMMGGYGSGGSMSGGR